MSYAQASQDLGVHTSQLRDWVQKFADDPEQAFPGHPTPITFIHCNAAVMAPLVPANVAIEQQAMNLHDPIDSLVIGRF